MATRFSLGSRSAWKILTLVFLTKLVLVNGFRHLLSTTSGRSIGTYEQAPRVFTLSRTPPTRPRHHSHCLASPTVLRASLTNSTRIEPLLTMSPPENKTPVSFSHVHLYADYLEDLSVYKDLENDLNRFTAECSSSEASRRSLAKQRELWQSLTENRWIDPVVDNGSPFVPHGRDVVKQLLAGLNFRVTASQFCEGGRTRTVLVTSKDPRGVQILVTALASPEEKSAEASEDIDTPYYFDAERIRTFYEAHSHRPGIAVLGFLANSVQVIHDRYQLLHPTLISHYDHSTSHHILEVFAYYQKDSKEADTGTILRFVQRSENESSVLPLPGIVPVPAQFDTSSSSAAAYCDHWVSNVWSRTEFLDTLSDTLGFTPKVDFNAGVVAAGEAQIESTVTGNDSDIATDNPVVALKDQSQVYLPINNALSSVGHVHGFLQELGQGIQHLASRVENLVDFVQTANDRRQVFGEGFTFLRIPRSYYGILTPNHLTNLPEDGGGDSMTTSSSLVSSECADAIMSVLQARGIVLADGAVDLQASMEDVHAALEHHLESRFTEEYMEHKESVLSTVARSRYQNLFALLRDHLSEETYLGIVRNQILVDIQGEDLLFQIFTGNIMQRQPGHEAPFFEFIQRVCAECKDEAGCPRKIRPGCGGFGIRNFLTLFLSIEVSKAIEEVSRARGAGDADGEKYAQAMVDYFTSQLNESNPILTEISDAMTLEGHCKEQLLLELAKQNDDRDPSQVQHWKSKMDEAAARKQRGNEKLMECSARYNALMKSLRERRNEALAAAAR